MKRLRNLGGLMLVSLAIALVGATTASAAQFTSGSSPTVLTASQQVKNILSVDTGQMECTENELAGTAVGQAFESVEMTPTYIGCTGFGFSMTVTMNGCRYKIYAAGTIDLVCPAGKDVAIDTAFNFCNVTVQPQTGLSSVSFTTHALSTGVHALVAHLAISNLKYTESGFACIASGKATTGGSLAGTLTIVGETEAGNPIGITHD